MRRTIAGFHQDDEGWWVAELSCLHRQHVRHQPPWQERPWVVADEERSARLGTELECAACDRAELPEGLRLVRTAGPWDESTVPRGLLRAHRVAPATWGALRVLDGRIRFTMATTPPLDREVTAGGVQPIPPEVAHEVGLCGPVRFEVAFLVR